MMKRRFRSVANDCRGAQIAEVAFVLPILFTVFFGVFYVARAYNIYATINEAAREGARVAALPTCVTCGGSSGTDAAVQNAVTTVVQANRLDPTKIQTPAGAALTACPGLSLTCTTPGNISVCRNARLTPGSGNVESCGVVVQFQYPIDFQAIPAVGALGTVQIQGHGEMRTED
jgi:Flp pilus assembly protein TadG